jgi:anti-sigma factor RsiW
MKIAAIAAVLAAFVAGGAAGWAARGFEAQPPTDLARFTNDALDAYRLYTVEVRHPVEVPGDQRPHLVEWLSKRVGSPLRAPELDKVGLKLVGGRLLPGPTGATAFFMYETPTGERFTLYCGHTTDRETALRYTTGEQNAAYYWVDRNLAYVLSGPAERDKLYAIAQAAYDQIDRRAPAQGG